MAKGPFSLTGAAESVGVHRSTVYRLRSRDAEFAAALEEARESSLDLIETKLFEASLRGIPKKVTTTRRFPDGTTEVTVREGVDFDPRPGMFILKRYRPEFRDSYRGEISGREAGPVHIDSIDVIDRRIAELEAELARRDRSTLRRGVSVDRTGDEDR